MAVITIRVERAGRVSGAGSSRRGRRPAVVAAAVATVAAAVGALLVGVPSAQASIVAIAPKVIASNVAMSGHDILALVVSGGSTTVPTDATRVQFAVSVTGATANGTVSSNPTATYPGSGDLVHYSSSGTGSGTIVERVGLSNQVTFHNNGANAITITIKITGYSTEVRASDVSGAGGSPGQVLTNTGAGAAWQTVSKTYTGYADGVTAQGLSFVETASVTVPAGTYVVTGRTVPHNFDSTNQPTRCDIQSSDGQDVDDSYMGVDAGADGEIVNLATITIATNGTTVDLQCITNATSMLYQRSRIVATLVGAVNPAGAARARHVTRGGAVSTR